MNISFVPAAESDYAFFARVHHAASREVVEKMYGWDEKIQDNFARKAFNEGGVDIIYREDKRLGILMWEEVSEYVWLKRVLLLPECQNQGVGSYIIKFLQGKAKKVNKELRLQTMRKNTGARRLYERHGFSVIDTTDIHWHMVWKPS